MTRPGYPTAEPEYSAIAAPEPRSRNYLPGDSFEALTMMRFPKAATVMTSSM
jgi:hypothetical protein